MFRVLLSVCRIHVLAKYSFLAAFHRWFCRCCYCYCWWWSVDLVVFYSFGCCWWWWCLFVKFALSRFIARVPIPFECSHCHLYKSMSKNCNWNSYMMDLYRFVCYVCVWKRVCGQLSITIWSKLYYCFLYFHFVIAAVTVDVVLASATRFFHPCLNFLFVFYRLLALLRA